MQTLFDRLRELPNLLGYTQILAIVISLLVAMIVGALSGGYAIKGWMIGALGSSSR